MADQEFRIKIISAADNTGFKAAADTITVNTNMVAALKERSSN